MTVTSKPHNFPALDGLRILATLWVLLFHLMPQITLFFGDTGWLGIFLNHGYLGVDIFFILSGFLIACHYTTKLVPFDATRYRQFLISKLLRIYPLHLAILLVLAVMVLSAPLIGLTINNPDDYNIGKFIAHVFLVSAWQFPTEMSWNYFAWAISVLWLMYLLAPFFLWVLSRVRSKIFLIFIGFVLSFITPFMVIYHPHESFVSYAIPRGFCGFNLGIILYFLMKDAIPLLTLRKTIITQFSTLTYALYMVQYPVLMFFKKILPPENFIHNGALYFIAEITTCLIMAFIGFYFIEKPINAYLKRKIFAG